MDAEFWHQKWENNEIGFHQGDVNKSLTTYVDSLGLPESSNIFLPLCGKTRDIAWLLSKGYTVTGAELSPIAIEQLFEELEVNPTLSTEGTHKRFSAPQLNVFVGDVFHLSPSLVGPIQGIYDRAALVALPPEKRKDYTHHLREITNNAPQLLITYEYDQSQMKGPPFSVTAAEVYTHYHDSYEINLQETISIPGGLKGKCPAQEKVWILS